MGPVDNPTPSPVGYGPPDWHRLAEHEFAKEVAKIRVGEDMGPLISEEQKKRVVGYIAKGAEEGLRTSGSAAAADNSPMKPVDPQGKRLPIKLDSTSNGEFEPIPLEPVNEHANRLAHETADRNSRRLNLTRREFLVSSSGAAATLLAFNAAYAMNGNRGGYFELDAEAGMDKDAADDALAKQEFIFDVQGHFVNPDGEWLKRISPDAKPLRGMPAAGCALADKPGEYSYLECLGRDQFIKDVFMDSDTDMMVLSFIPSSRENEPLTIEEAAAESTRNIDVIEDINGSAEYRTHLTHVYVARAIEAALTT